MSHIYTSECDISSVRKLWHQWWYRAYMRECCSRTKTKKKWINENTVTHNNKIHVMLCISSSSHSRLNERVPIDGECWTNWHDVQHTHHSQCCLRIFRALFWSRQSIDSIRVRILMRCQYEDGRRRAAIISAAIFVIKLQVCFNKNPYYVM